MENKQETTVLNTPPLPPVIPPPLPEITIIDLSRFDKYYQKEFKKLIESNEEYKGKWNWTAFLFSNLWCFVKGCWGYGLIITTSNILTYGTSFQLILLLGWPIIMGLRGTRLLYNVKIKKKQFPNLFQTNEDVTPLRHNLSDVTDGGIEHYTKESTSKVIIDSRYDQPPQNKRSNQRTGLFVGTGVALIITAGIAIFIIARNSNKVNMPAQAVTPVSQAKTDSVVPESNQPIQQEVVAGSENEQGWQAILSPEFKFYTEDDDVPGQVERYKDNLGHWLIAEAWGRNITSNNEDTATNQALNLAFNGKEEPIKTLDTLFVSTGAQISSAQDTQYYYTIYCPKFMQSYSLYSNQNDTLFSNYSEKLLDAIRVMKSSN